MPYDKSLDAEIFKEMKELGDTRLTVGVFSYNGGEKKMQITRENKDSSEQWRFDKLGRITKPELKEIIPIMMKAVEKM